MFVKLSWKMNYCINNKQVLSITSSPKAYITMQLKENLVYYIDFIEELHIIKYYSPMHITHTSLQECTFIKMN